MKGDLALFVTEQRAILRCEIEVDRATEALVANIDGGGSPRRHSARFRFQQAMTALQTAQACLNKRKCELAGIRHLQIVLSSDHRAEEKNP